MQNSFLPFYKSVSDWDLDIYRPDKELLSPLSPLSPLFLVEKLFTQSDHLTSLFGAFQLPGGNSLINEFCGSSKVLEELCYCFIK